MDGRDSLPDERLPSAMVSLRSGGHPAICSHRFLFPVAQGELNFQSHG